jgi:PiT family inorganic phosphate transporter
MLVFFLTSGLFLGWSLGANDAANVFGTAVGSRMIKFITAAVLCSIFVIIGSVMSGAGASHTLGDLGSVNAIAGAFIVAFAAALSVYLMTKAGYPVSTSQAIVGAIIGWNLFSGSLTDYNALIKIVVTWVACPVLAAVFSIVFYKVVSFFITRSKIHMFRLDQLTRYGLLLAGIFGSYSLGANNIANVMGVFVPVSPFSDISFYGIFNLTSSQQLFFIGGLAIAAGVFTYSKRVMMTVGVGIMELSPVAALIVVWSHALVLFLFASQGLEGFLIRYGLPTIPLVPVSSSQAIVGCIIGLGIIKGGRGLRWRVLGGISGGWVATPIIAALVSFISLFFLQNVFQQQTYRPMTYILSSEAIERVRQAGIPSKNIEELVGREFTSAAKFDRALSNQFSMTRKERDYIIESAEVDEIAIQKEKIDSIKTGWITENQQNAIERMDGRVFTYKWQFDAALAETSPAWQFSKNNKKYNEDLKNKLSYIHRLFRPESD